MALEVSSGEFGELSVSLTLSKWDAALDISAPPADEVQ
jgi:hypothetical protein